MTKLQAINLILRAGGLRPVAAVDTDGASDAAEAERLLDEVDLEVQATGWHFNTRYDVELSPNDDGDIVPETSIITIDSYGDDECWDVALVGGKLYDLEDNTFTFTEDIDVWYILRYEFECIPYPVRDYIAREAAYRFAENRPGLVSRAQLQMLFDQKTIAYSRAQSFNARTRNNNMLDSTPFKLVKGTKKSVNR